MLSSSSMVTEQRELSQTQQRLSEEMRIVSTEQQQQQQQQRSAPTIDDTTASSDFGVQFDLSPEFRPISRTQLDERTVSTQQRATETVTRETVVSSETVASGDASQIGVNAEMASRCSDVADCSTHPSAG